MVCPTSHISLWLLRYEALKIIALLSFFSQSHNFIPANAKKQALSAHGVCYALTAKKPTHDWFYFVTPPPMETCKKVKANRKRQKTLEHRVIVEQLLGEVVLILFLSNRSLLLWSYHLIVVVVVVTSLQKVCP